MGELLTGQVLIVAKVQFCFAMFQAPGRNWLGFESAKRQVILISHHARAKDD